MARRPAVWHRLSTTALAGIGLVAVALPASVSDAVVRGSEWRRDVLLTPPPVDTRHAHSIRQNPTSGRLWVGRDFIGGAERPLPLLRREPGPTAYGAPSADLRLIRARINNSVVGINPWARIHGIGSLETLESARNQWLKENGYTGGVRTFVNPRHRESYLNSPAGRRHALAAYAHQGQHRATPRHPGDRPTGEIRPRATFELPADMPRFTPRMQVLGSPATGDRADPRVARLGSDAPVHAQVTRLD